LTYFLDTTVIIDLLRKKIPAVDFITLHMDDAFITSCICEMEIASGIYREEESKIEKRRREVKDLFNSFYQVLPFNSEQAYIAGQIKAGLAKKGELIDDLDILIGAAVLYQQSVLVTSNIRHFTRIKNLQIHKL